jgi:hypothetical protein
MDDLTLAAESGKIYCSWWAHWTGSVQGGEWLSMSQMKTNSCVLEWKLAGADHPSIKLKGNTVEAGSEIGQTTWDGMQQCTNETEEGSHSVPDVEEERVQKLKSMSEDQGLCICIEWWWCLCFSIEQSMHGQSLSKT